MRRDGRAFEPWDDAKLYKKYKLTREEIAFIESMIKSMG